MGSRLREQKTFEAIASPTQVLRVRMKTTGLLLFAFVAVLLAGCSSPVATRKVVSLDGFQHIFVERRLNDNNHLDDYLVAELKRLGRDATSGPITMLPTEGVDAVLSYDARWEWDFKTYLIECNVVLRKAYTDKKLAEGRYYRPSIRSSDIGSVVHDLLGSLFAPGK